MIAVDTNILVRYAVKDDPPQTVEATRFLGNHACFVLKTVLLELVWVLSSRSGYGSLEKSRVKFVWATFVPANSPVGRCSRP